MRQPNPCSILYLSSFALSEQHSSSCRHPHNCGSEMDALITAGEVLNCDIWTVAARAAVDLQADKVICMTLPEFQVPESSITLWHGSCASSRHCRCVYGDTHS